MTAFQRQLASQQTQTLALPFEQELIVDLFAGGGGASSGIARAWREPDVAVNHNEIAIAVHRANHPQTQHYVADVFEVDPLVATRGLPVALLWASPDCKHFSKAKGGAPRDRKVRGLAWVVIRWLHATRPRLMHLENVEEFCDWGPVDDEGQPIKAERGRTFRAFISAMSSGLAENHPDMPEIMAAIGEFVPVEALVRGLGYTVDWRERVAANAGAPTIRKRLYLIARRDGKPIVWPGPVLHKQPSAKQEGWRTSAECIDWSNLGRTIFRAKPMAKNTLRRVAKGLWRHVLTSPKPFIVPMRGTSAAHTSTHGVDEPLSTVSAGGNHHDLVQPVVTPFLTECANGSSQRNFDIQEPLRTQVAQVKGGHFAVVAGHLTHLTHHAVSAAFIEQANGGFYDGDGRPADAPLSTICQSGANQRLVNAYLVKYYGNEKDGVSLREPMHTLPTKDRVAVIEVERVLNTLTSEQLEGAQRCAAFMHEHLPEHFKEKADLVMLDGYVLVDITLRMLKPPELKKAQGFSHEYIIDRGFFVDPETGIGEWRDINITDQVKLIGNSVSPYEAYELVKANAADLIDLYRRLAA
ncbi:DNA cytosine methyltransferase [Pseudomonas cichorii]|uniref:DNA cytosine methyltransferase n=1 Tax=Pseudomonas cichorii TaxID=36746 RepID=UPI001C8A24B6|nr:DNA cytosine methyltransferase [Pseudomonas cichorii]MBX8528502.1 DNA cytosine methyltransferase [Pseudomonas cichorii]